MDYQLRTHPRARKITLRLNRAGQPVVTVPKLMPKFLVDKFIASQQNWITTNQQKIKSLKNQFATATTITVFGKQYAKETLITESPSGVKITGKKLVISLHQSKTAKKEAEVLNKFLKNTASHYITAKTHQLAKKMDVKFNKLSYRAQTSRWGSCSSTGNLSFNWKLVHFAPQYIDYVIIHELAHLKHLNHSKHFWQLVAKFDPEYQLHQGWLKRTGIAVG